MSKLTLDHVGAIDRCVTSVLKEYQTGQGQRVTQQLDKDLARLEELRMFVLKSIYNQGILFGPEDKPS